MALPPDWWLGGGYVVAMYPQIDLINLGIHSQYIGSNTVETKRHAGSAGDAEGSQSNVLASGRNGMGLALSNGGVWSVGSGGSDREKR